MLKYRLQMRFRRSIRLSRLFAAVGWGAVASMACGSAIAADRTAIRQKIQFSSPDEPVDWPTPGPKVSPLSKPFEFLGRGNSVSAVVGPWEFPGPHALPNYPRNARLLEALDHKKNWIYVRSDDLIRAKTLEELFGVRDSGATNKKPKTALERFFEDRRQTRTRDESEETLGEWNRTETKKNHDPGFDPGRDGRSEADANSRLDPLSSRVDPLDSERPLTAGFSVSGNFFGAAQGQGRLNGSGVAGWRDSLSGARRGQNRPDEFRQLLAVPGIANPLLPSFDPLNLQTDTSRQELNPILAQRLGVLPGAGGDALNPFRVFSGPTGSRSSLLGDQGPGVLGSSSLSPAVPVPTETPFTQPKPAVLDFPRRRF